MAVGHWVRPRDVRGKLMTSTSLLRPLWGGITLLLLAANPRGATAGTNEFLARVYTGHSGKTLPYRLLLPKHYDPKQPYPVILYLHGAAARGHDNTEPLHWGPELFLEKSLRDKHGFFLVVPQCPKDSGWVEFSWSSPTARESPSLELSLELIDKALPKEFNIDPKRRYLTGVSMGGHAVWVEMVRRPGFFAAAVPVCSGGNARIVTTAAAKFPVWAFHSDDDHLVPVQQARDLVQAWRAHGGIAKYTEYTGLKHSSWKRAYVDPEMFDWLFAQHLP
jgi:predicted peptidase